MPTTAPPPANLAYVEGGVDLIHDGVADRAVAGTMLSDGDLVRTLNGRAEIVFADGTLLHLDYDTALELLSPVRLRLSGGRLSLRVSASATPYAIDTAAATVRLDPRGEYGLTADGRLSRLEVSVARGVAEIDDGGGPTLVRGGETASILGTGGRVHLQQFNSARWDAFERWANDRANGFSTAASARQLPSELRPYGGVFDTYGRWDYVAPYGNVWFPAVAADWRPYYTGAWRSTRYGWTWIGHDPWSWPTHHFGRWGFTGVSWYWIPARVWGPAWVSWSFSPGFVSWCPLGFDGRAVIGYSHVSSWFRGGRDHPDYRPYYDPWRAWTMMPRDAFDGRRPVRTNAIDPTRLPEDTRRSMINTAVPRESVGPPLPATDVRVPGRGFETPRGVVRSPNAAPVTPPAPAASASARPENPARYGETSPERPAFESREGEPRVPGAGAAPRTYYPRPYDRGSAVERRGETRQDDPADSPRTYTPSASARPENPARYGETSPERPGTRSRDGGPSYATPRAGRPARSERAETPPPPPPSSSRGRDESAGRGADRPAAGGWVRSPNAGAARESGEGRSASPPPSRSSGSEGQSRSSGGGGGAVRRRP